MNKPLTISLVIPVYNEESHLAACLDAVANQRTMPREVIVVDNNSTDASASIAARYSFVQVIQEPRQGRVYAQATGFAAATGTAFARIDTDTLLQPDWTEAIGLSLQSADAVTGKAVFYDAPFPRVTSWLQVTMYQYFQKALTGSYIIWGTNMAVTRDAWNQVAAAMPLRPELDEDIVLSLLLRRHGKVIAYNPHLQVRASLRRGQLGVVETMRYLSTWPRDYWWAGLYIQSTIIALMCILIIISTMPITLSAQLMQALKRRSV